MILCAIYIIFALNICIHVSCELDQTKSDLQSTDNKTTDQRDADFQSIYNFVLELINDSDTILEYVAKVQAIFCPDLPICDLKGPRERNDILKTVSEAIVTGNRTIWLEDIPTFVGACCLPCSCSSTCFEASNCCPTKYYSTTDANIKPAITECIPATAKGYIISSNEDIQFARYFMVIKCFEHKSDTLTLSKCETPNARSFNDTGPVTSVKTGKTYWNIHCAVCNNDAADLAEWETNVEFKHDFVFTHSWYPNSFEELHPYLYVLGNIIYKPPSNLSVEILQCLHKDKDGGRSCPKNDDEKNSYDDSFIFDLCQQFYNPVFTGSYKVPLMNIFCLFCQENLISTPEETDCNWLEDFRSSPGEMTALLNYKTDGKDIKLNTYGDGTENQGCSCAQVYDNYQGICRPIFCPLGEFTEECRCVQPFKSLTGMPIILKLKITSEQKNSFPIEKGKIRAFHRALKNVLKATVEQITATIIATFKPETDEEKYYLCVVMIRSDKGHDTKETVKPFMKYLDSTRYLEFKSDKVLFVARLISTMLFWIERDIEFKNIFRAQDLGKNNHTLLPVYSNADLKSASDGEVYYQLLSPLLFCMQVELSENEFIEKGGLVIVNRSSAMTSTPDYYRLAGGNIRICLDFYLQTSGKALNALSGTLRIITFVVQFFSFSRRLGSSVS